MKLFTPSFLTIKIAHNAIVSLIKEVGVAEKKVVLWGHGMGGFIALSFGGVYPNVCSYVILLYSMMFIGNIMNKYLLLELLLHLIVELREMKNQVLYGWQEKV